MNAGGKTESGVSTKSLEKEEEKPVVKPKEPEIDPVKEEQMKLAAKKKEEKKKEK